MAAPAAPATNLRPIAELACDGAWTAKQLATRVAEWRSGPSGRCISREVVLVRPTAWARRPIEVKVIRLSPRGLEVARALGAYVQVVRSGELEHALGLAELRWRCGIPADSYTPQDAIRQAHQRAIAVGDIGLGSALWDGTYDVDGRRILCEYDHGRYTARQVREKLTAFHLAAQVNGAQVVGTVWGVPTEQRRAWLRDLGASDVVVIDPATWLA